MGILNFLPSISAPTFYPNKKKLKKKFKIFKGPTSTFVMTLDTILSGGLKQSVSNIGYFHMFRVAGSGGQLGDIRFLISLLAETLYPNWK